MAPILIYCAGKNKHCDEIAKNTGFKLGARLPGTAIHFPPYFIDQDWQRAKKEPGYRERYMSILKQWRPNLATVLDWEEEDQLTEVLGWAEDAAQFVETVIIIPKVIGGIERLPRIIGKKPIRLGYSVPTRFGGTPVPIREFLSWPVHLLGGSPHKQMRLIGYPIFFGLEVPKLNVVSVDGNMILKMATTRGAFWYPNPKKYQKGYWPTVSMADGKKWGDGTSKADVHYEAFQRSCNNIMRAWKEIDERS